MAIRAMLNFGFTKLRIVSDKDFAQDRQCNLAAGEYSHLLEYFETFPTLKSAISDMNQVYALSARSRHMSTLSSRIQHIPVRYTIKEAFVFGCEKNGLSNDELTLCSHTIQLPTSHICSSMNLSHAVAVVCYQISQTTLQHIDKHTHSSRDYEIQDRIQRNETEILMNFLETALDERNYFREQHKKLNMLQTLRVILDKAQLSQQEYRSLLGALRSLATR